MPDTRRIVFLYEGDDDKAVLEKLQNAGLIPGSDELEIAKRNKGQHDGKDGLFSQLVPLISPVDGLDARVAVLIDLDDNDAGALGRKFESTLRKRIGELKGSEGIAFREGTRRGRLSELIVEKGDRRGSVVLVPVGYPEDDETNRRFGIDSFAIDDWILRLLLDRGAFEAVPEFQKLGFDRAMQKFVEMSDLLRQNGLEVRKAKTYIQFMRVLADVRPSTSTIIGRIVEKSHKSLGSEGFHRLLKPFLDDLADAVAILRASKS